MLRGLELHDGLVDTPVVAWSDDNHVIVMLRDSTRPNVGPLYVALLRDRNVVDQWQRAREGKVASVTVVRSPDARDRDSAFIPSQIVSVDVRTGTKTTLARGPLHHPTLSADRRTLTYWRESPPLGAAPVASFLDPSANADAAYIKVDWGGEVHHVDAKTGAEIAPPDTARPPPRDTSVANLRVRRQPDNATQLVLERHGHADTVLWRGNLWARVLHCDDNLPCCRTLAGTCGPPPSYVAAASALCLGILPAVGSLGRTPKKAAKLRGNGLWLRPHGAFRRLIVTH
jgi:hypothetical protein